MWCNLCLKTVQFTLSFGFLFLDHFPHQFFDPDCHLLNRASQMIHFKTSGSMDFDIQLSGWNSLDILLQVADRSCQHHWNIRSDNLEKQNYLADDRQHKKSTFDPITSKFFFPDHTNDLPSGVSHRLDTAEHLLFPDFCFIGSILIFSQCFWRFFYNPTVYKGVPGMVDQFSVWIHQKRILVHIICWVPENFR